ncbi:hypothetical protein CVT24_002581 [Panaeolus cyanescens]|uniref:DUF6535 domain-containing protein n=1 Tax=Panaeolus cyanescens TaxID=181874 RepID=A0A409WB64_9AGAR|nr:hypothetical protein CVT24_002581 [Panaeolus cyanescens]
MASDELTRQPTRVDSQETRIQVEVEQELPDSPIRWDAPEKPGRVSSQSQYYSVQDNPYQQFASRRQSRIPNLKAASPYPGSQADIHEQDRPWKCGDPYRHLVPTKGDSWHRCHKLAEKYDNEMCDAWKEEVDKLLIFAGLFSATVTAFTVESYQWLSEESEDVSAKLLGYIANHLYNSTATRPTPPFDFAADTFSVDSSDVRINTVWFLSLTLSLTTVLIGILCLQWLREFQRDAALPHKEAVALRQMRYEGLLHWKVPEILSVLPILLQLSLILFFMGLLELLWTRNRTVAIFVSAVIAVVMLFLGITTALPALQHAFTRDNHLRIPQCPYKSPQSWLCYRSCNAIFRVISTLQIPKFELPFFHRLFKSATDLNWMTFDMRWRQLRDAEEVVRGTAKKLRDSDDLIHSLQWINNTFTQSVEAVYPIYHNLGDMDISVAAATVSGFYQDGQIDNATLRVMLDDRFSPTEDQKREIILAYYLHLHCEAHPILKPMYVENVIRILNSQEVPPSFYEWISQILQDLATASPSNTSSSALLNPDLSIQALLCVKNLITRNRRGGLQTLDIVVAWSLLHRLLSSSISTVPDDRSVDVNVNTHYLKVACDLFEVFEGWIAQGKAIERWERVKVCAEGMMTIFPPSTDITVLQSLCPEMDKAVDLVQSLEDHIDALGGPSAILLKEGWWLDYWDLYTEDDWGNLLKNFQAVSGTS